MFKSKIALIAAFCRNLIDRSDLFLAVGMAFVFYGFFLIYSPLAFIITGCISLWVAWNTADGATVQPDVTEAQE